MRICILCQGHRVHASPSKKEKDGLIPQNELGILSFSSARFSRNYNGLAHLQNLHVSVGFVG